jgi:hypothetical protein
VSEEAANNRGTWTALVNSVIHPKPEADRPLGHALRGNAAFIRSCAFSPGQDSEWFAASLDRLAARADTLAAANKALHEALAEQIKWMAEARDHGVTYRSRDEMIAAASTALAAELTA